MDAKLIVIEGVDGTGKRTQAELLVNYLRENLIKANLIGFPDYDGTQMGRTIGEMLSGKLGDLRDVHPYFSASLFALDRGEKRLEICEMLERNEWVVCDRYVYSNVAHQACRLPSGEREKFLRWVEHLEFDILQLPKADMTFLLSMEDLHSKALREQRQAHSYSGSVLDLHELDLTGMSNARQIYEELGRDLGWKIIDCTQGGGIRTIADISSEIKKNIQFRVA